LSEEKHLERYYEVDIRSAGGKQGHYPVMAATDTEAKEIAAKRWVVENMGSLTIDVKEVKVLTRGDVK